jgi:hypothetical protein
MTEYRRTWHPGATWFFYGEPGRPDHLHLRLDGPMAATFLGTSHPRSSRLQLSRGFRPLEPGKTWMGETRIRLASFQFPCVRRRGIYPED